MLKNKRYQGESAQSLINPTSFIALKTKAPGVPNSGDSSNRGYCCSTYGSQSKICANNDNYDDKTMISYTNNHFNRPDTGPGRTPRFPKRNKKARASNLDPNFIVYNNEVLPVKAGHKISFVDKDGTKTTLAISDLDAKLMSQSDLLETYLTNSKCDHINLNRDEVNPKPPANTCASEANSEPETEPKIKTTAKTKKYAICQKPKTRRYTKIGKKSSKPNINLIEDSPKQSVCTQTEEPSMTSDELIRNDSSQSLLSDMPKTPEPQPPKSPKIKVVAINNSKFNSATKNIAVSSDTSTATSYSTNKNNSNISNLRNLKNKYNNNIINNNNNNNNNNILKHNNDMGDASSNKSLNKLLKDTLVKTNPSSQTVASININNFAIHNTCDDTNCNTNSNNSNNDSICHFNTNKAIINTGINSIDDNNINTDARQINPPKPINPSLSLLKKTKPSTISAVMMGDNRNIINLSPSPTNQTLCSKMNDVIENEYINRLLSICMFVTLITILITTIWKVSFEDLIEILHKITGSIFAKNKNEDKSGISTFLGRIFSW